MSSTTIISESKQEEADMAEEKVADIQSSSEDSDVETDEGEILSDVDSTVSDDYVDIDDETRTTVECQTTSHTCGICYKKLHLGNSVTTICQHEFCNKCFFRWITTNATCPMCREPVDSKTNLTDEQLGREMSDIYGTYVNFLEENSRLFSENRSVRQENSYMRQKNSSLKVSTTKLLQRQIRLREQIDETRGYNEGFISGLSSYKKKLGYNVNTKDLSSMSENIYFHKGFREGFNIQEEVTEKIERKVNRQNIRIKLRRRGNIMVESSLEELKTTNKSSSDEDVVVL